LPFPLLGKKDAGETKLLTVMAQQSSKWRSEPGDRLMLLTRKKRKPYPAHFMYPFIKF